jgi:hypothetical protein
VEVGDLSLAYRENLYKMKNMKPISTRFARGRTLLAERKKTVGMKRPARNPKLIGAWTCMFRYVSENDCIPQYDFELPGTSSMMLASEDSSTSKIKRWSVGRGSNRV